MTKEGFEPDFEPTDINNGPDGIVELEEKKPSRFKEVVCKLGRCGLAIVLAATLAGSVSGCGETNTGAAQPAATAAETGQEAEPAADIDKTMDSLDAQLESGEITKIEYSEACTDAIDAIRRSGDSEQIQELQEYLKISSDVSNEEYAKKFMEVLSLWTMAGANPDNIENDYGSAPDSVVDIRDIISDTADQYEDIFAPILFGKDWKDSSYVVAFVSRATKCNYAAMCNCIDISVNHGDDPRYDTLIVRVKAESLDDDSVEVTYHQEDNSDRIDLNGEKSVNSGPCSVIDIVKDGKYAYAGKITTTYP